MTISTKISSGEESLGALAKERRISAGGSKRYDKDFKSKVISLHRHGVSLASLSAELKVPKSTIYSWISGQKKQGKSRKKSQKNSFRELAIRDNITPSRSYMKNTEARIKLPSGLSIFVPISALNQSLISQLEGWI